MAPALEPPGIPVEALAEREIVKKLFIGMIILQRCEICSKYKKNRSAFNYGQERKDAYYQFKEDQKSQRCDMNSTQLKVHTAKKPD